MFKEVEVLKVDGKTKLPLLANGATSVRFRQVFHRDLMAEISKYQYLNSDPDAVDWELPAKMAYIMNAAAEKKDMNTLSEEGYMEFLEEFEGDTLWNIQNDVTDCYLVNQQVKSTGKK